MKLIKQSFEVINQADFSLIGIKKHIERCARISYKSEDKITDKSYLKFIDMLSSKGHTTTFEFGTVHLKMSYPTFSALKDVLIENNLYNFMWIRFVRVGINMYITTNYAYYLRMLKVCPRLVDYFVENNDDNFPKRITVRFITSRVIAQELTRHRAFSFVMESQRYCAYNKEKFDGQVTYIIPCWMNIKEGNFTYNDYQNIYPEEIKCKTTISEKFLISAYENEDTYFSLLKEHQTPQQARVVLSNNVKTELYMCGFDKDWEHFFELRDVSTVDPQMYDLAHKLKQSFDEIC